MRARPQQPPSKREFSVSVHTLALENATLTRVGYTDVAIPGAIVGITPDDIARIPWRSPALSDGDLVRIGAAVWFADIDGVRFAFDPFQAADSVLRANREAEAMHQHAIAALLTDAGFARDRVNRLVMTHIEGVGMVAWRNDDGSWSPFFPNARVLISDVELREFLRTPSGGEDDLQFDAWHALIDLGVVDTYVDGEPLARGFSPNVRGAHCPGHALLDFAGTDYRAQTTMIGHLAVSPLHLATGECPALQSEPARAWSVLRETIEDGRRLIGPLWPSPGFGRWADGEFVLGA